MASEKMCTELMPPLPRLTKVEKTMKERESALERLARDEVESGDREWSRLVAEEGTVE